MSRIPVSVNRKGNGCQTGQESFFFSLYLYRSLSLSLSSIQCVLYWHNNFSFCIAKATYKNRAREVGSEQNIKWKKK